jgi:hypothetical protein
MSFVRALCLVDGGGNEETDTMSYSLLAMLTQHAFFEGLERNAVARLKEDILERGWPAIFEESHRVHWVDPVALKAAGVGEFLARLRPFLRREGVQMGEVVDDFGPETYSVELARNAYRIFDRAEVSGAGAEAELARVAFTRTVHLVNDLLRRAGSPERLYTIPDPPAMRVIFLTPELRELIVDHPEATPEECPQSPDEWE